MKIETLHHLVTLAKAGSFYQASKLTGLTVQGYSKALASLEKELGAALATRDRDGIHLTKAGEILLDFSVATINEMSRTIESIANLDAESPRETNSSLRLHVTHSCLQELDLIDSFRDILKRIDIREEPFSDILARLHYANSDDIFFVDMYSDPTLSEYPTLSELEKQEICYEPLCHSLIGIVVCRDSPISKLTQISKSDVASLDLAHYSHREWNYFIDKVFGFELLANLRFEGTSIRMLVDYAHEGKTRAIISDSYGFRILQKNPRYNSQDLKFIPIADSSADFSIGFLYSRKHLPSLRAQAVMDCFRNYFQALASTYREASSET